ncbi:MAG: M3 family oligoendopeptidase [Pseudomonadota bacterium]|nr:M3 family oligoendopeptidase [Pseudomonadota bacterium]
MTTATLQSSSKSALGNLPEWDLSDLYPSIDSAELKSDLGRAAREARAFSNLYKGKLSRLTGSMLGEAISTYETIDEIMGRIMSYAQLVYAGNISDPEIGRFYQSMQERLNGISADVLFFPLELNEIDDRTMSKQLKTPRVAVYRPWLNTIRALRPHQLSEEMEKLLHDKRIAGRAAWSRLFDETMADMRFVHNDSELTSEEVMNMLSDPEEGVREASAKTLGKELEKHARTFSLITNTLAKDKEIEDRWRGFARPETSRNLANQVEDEVVDALNAAVTGSYADLSHRYYAMKATWFGKETLDHWDRNAPLPEADNSVIPWAQATETVLTAYRDFSPDLADIGQRFFDNAWIDARVREGKSSGAFAHPTVPSAHPYLLLNYQGKTRDVMTLAHELGHGCHQMLAAPQGNLMADTPLTLAETASVFGEMLTFRKMLRAEDDPVLRKVMLAGKVEDMLNTVVRQIAFFNFELRVHTARREGELTAEDICDIWMEVQSESLGPAIRFNDNYRWYWTYIPHFIHSPFYVYAYAFGDCLVNSLYAAYEQAAAGFAEKYLDMLCAGGTLRHRELLAPFGLDASDPAFWQKGLNVVRGMIDDLEELE